MRTLLERADFMAKQILFLFMARGEKLSFKNDNLVVTVKDGSIKYQVTCYRVFMVIVVGELSITSGLIKRAKRYGFVICLMTPTFKLYSIIGNRMEGNTVLHRKQYKYEGDEIAQFLVKNKIRNQRNALNRIREKTILCKEAIKHLDSYLESLQENSYSADSLLGIEGSASRVYFPQIFDQVNWRGRRPRTKCDYVNTTLDIGYNMLFHLVDSLLQVFGFDVYCGVYHREYYMRKSLVCDLMEPLRPIVDWEVRKAIHLNQCKESDFFVTQNQYMLDYKSSSRYVEFLMGAILERKNDIFLFIRDYYRSFMKEKEINGYNEIDL